MLEKRHASVLVKDFVQGVTAAAPGKAHQDARRDGKEGEATDAGDRMSLHFVSRAVRQSPLRGQLQTFRLDRTVGKS